MKNKSRRENIATALCEFMYTIIGIIPILDGFAARDNNRVMRFIKRKFHICSLY